MALFVVVYTSIMSSVYLWRDKITSYSAAQNRSICFSPKFQVSVGLTVSSIKIVYILECQSARAKETRMERERKKWKMCRKYKGCRIKFHIYSRNKRKSVGIFEFIDFFPFCRSLTPIAFQRHRQSCRCSLTC